MANSKCAFVKILLSTTLITGVGLASIGSAQSADNTTDTTTGLVADVPNVSWSNTANVSNSPGSVAAYVPYNFATGTNFATGRITGTGADAVSVNGNGDTLINHGTIVSNTHHGVYTSGGVGTLTNSGTITGRGGVSFDGGVDTFYNSGIISGTDWSGVNIGNGGPQIQSMTNSGTISASNSNGIFSNVGVLAFLNTGTISGGGDGDAVGFNGDSGSFINEGTITGKVNIDGDLTSFNNSGDISTTLRATVAVDGRIENFTNSGTITGSDSVTVYAHDGVGTFLNTGTITHTDASNGTFFRGTTNSFTNQGTISGRGGSGFDALQNFNNSGTIVANGNHTGVWVGVGAPDVVSFTNSGSVSGFDRAAVEFNTGAASFNNSGSLRSTNYDAVVLHGNAPAFVNSGTISGVTGIKFEGLTIGQSAQITNSGAIEGTGGTAILFGDGDDSLTLLSGSTIMGTIDFAGGSDTFDFSGLTGTEVFEVDGIFGETIVSGDNLFEWVGETRIAIVEAAEIATAASSAGSVSTSVASEIGAVVSNQLSSLGAGVSSPAAPAVPAGSSVLGYAPAAPANAADSAVLSALDVGQTPVPAPTNNAWITGFGGVSHDQAPTDLLNIYGGIVAGSHARFGDTTIGLLTGVSKSALNIGFGGQTINTLTGVVGVYGHQQIGILGVDFSLMGGLNGHESARQVIFLGNPQTASATFASWFITPTLGLQIPLLETDNGILNVATSVSYVGGTVSGYTETGSGLNLTIGNTPIHVLQAKVELNGQTKLSQNDFGSVVLSAKAGLSVQSNLGGSTIPVSFLGGAAQNVVTPDSTVYGAYAGAMISAPISQAAHVQFGVDVSARNDGLVSASGNVKLGIDF